MILHPLGYRQDAFDPRDKVFVSASVGAAQLSALPAVFSMREAAHAVKPIKQVKSESCVLQVFALATAMVWHERYGMGKNTPVLSRRAASYLARSKHGEQHENVGTYPRIAAAAITGMGFTTEDICPFDEDLITEPLDADVLAAMTDQERVFQYRRIWFGETFAEALVQAKSALALQRRPIGIAIPVVDSFDRYENGVWRPSSSQGARGWHYLTIIGYDDELQAFECVNSWWNHGIVEEDLSIVYIGYREAIDLATDPLVIYPSALPSHLNANQNI